MRASLSTKPRLYDNWGNAAGGVYNTPNLICLLYTNITKTAEAEINLCQGPWHQCVEPGIIKTVLKNANIYLIFKIYSAWNQFI